jgi:hypothetical protein
MLRRLRWFSFLALCAACVQTLAPLHATAMALGEWRNAAGICSTDGLPAGHAALYECPWCAPAYGSSPPASQPGLVLATGDAHDAPARLAAPAYRLQHSPAQPRAPPSRS